MGKVDIVMPKRDAFYRSVKDFYSKLSKIENSSKSGLAIQWLELDDITHMAIVFMATTKTYDKTIGQKRKNLLFLGRYFDQQFMP